VIQIIPTQVGFKLIADEICIGNFTVHQARALLRAEIKRQGEQPRINLLRRGIDVYNAYVAELK